MKTLQILMTKYKDIIPYVFFGVCTTAVNVIAYWCTSHLLGQKLIVSTIFAWIIAVLFAYITNRKWVFHSRANSITGITKEILSFFSCRLVTGFIDIICMYLFVDIFGFNDVVVKFGANILVILLNYIASKFIIFRG